MKAAASTQQWAYKKLFRLWTHNDNIIQSELLIVNVSICVCASCGMMVLLGATATGHESKRNRLAF